jgi:DNA-binding protein H-NS
MRGRKVAIKYRDKSGNTWAGRGVQPRWLTAAIKAGAKRDDFLVDKSAGKAAQKVRKKRRAKRNSLYSCRNEQGDTVTWSYPS